MMTPERKLPDRGRPSPGYGHLGMWNYCLGPNSPIPGERLIVLILDENRNIVRRLEQVEGRCMDEGHVDFFLGPNCRPARHERPLLDIAPDGQAAVLHPDYRQGQGMETYLQIVKGWATRWGKPEYALAGSR
jgi:hypothetical protein